MKWILLALIARSVFAIGAGPGPALYLTPLIESNQISRARSSAKVNHPDLPGQSYSGYFTVNQTANSNLFFWFFEAQTNPLDAPLALWLQGGPGYSALYGIFMENGPYFFDENSSLQQRYYTWTKFTNIIYIDNPVGTGFSYTDDDNYGYSQYQSDIVANLFPAIDQFFKVFSEYQKNDFYVIGESYGGKYAVSVADAIRQRNKKKNQQAINLTGVILESGVVDPTALNLPLYAQQASLIDSNGYQTLLNYQNIGLNLVQQGDYTDAFLLGTEPLLTEFYTLSGLNQEFNYLADEIPFSSAITPFIERTDIRAAIHVGNNTLQNILGTDTVYFYLIDDLLRSVTDQLPELFENYQFLIYSGQLDIIAAAPSVETYLENINYANYTGATRNAWFDDAGNSIGWLKTAGNILRATIRNAGHVVPYDQPKVTFELVRRFILGLPPPPTNN